jgi:succinyl-diaminopimelate desuccinylase
LTFGRFPVDFCGFMPAHNTIANLASALIKLPSVTPDDAGCLTLLSTRLEYAGFVPQRLKYGEVDNLWISHGNGDPVLCFLGHIDVVPPGPLEAWQVHPFQPEIRDGFLYGRGAADMKGSVAAMTIALERYVAGHPRHRGSLAMLLTSDEEGRAVDGTARVVDHLRQQGIRIRWCLVGEPSSRDSTGDTVKNGRRGSLTGHLVIHGIQGHVAYPERADNPVHRVVPALAELCNTVWDRGNEHYPPTSLQISNLTAGTGADNVIPGQARVQFNFRYSTETTEGALMEKVVAVLKRHGLRYDLEWLPSSKPFLTRSGELLTVTQKIIRETTGKAPEVSTSGGTSDGRFIAPAGAEVVELGPVNATIHQVNECVKVADLELLAVMYEKIIIGLLGE